MSSPWGAVAQHLARSLALLALLATAASAAPAGKAPAPPGPADDDCLACHDDASAQRADGTPLRFDKGQLAESLHGQAGLACTDCHAELLKSVEFPHSEKLQKVECGSCHEDAAQQYAKSIHFEARHASQGSPAASCTDCHGSHGILPSKDARSLTHHLRLAATCGRCHGDAATIEQAGMRIGNAPKLFEDSIHGRALREKGLVVAPNCGNCHGNHDIRRASDPASRVNRDAIPGTCGSCHEGIKTEYEKSIHWEQHKQGNPAGAICSDCHSAHGINATNVAAWRLDVVRECGTCHESRIRTYRDGFHGKITSLGYARVATCSDCHGSHAIRPEGDPASAVHPDRRPATCGKCHENATASFVKYDPHADPHDKKRSEVLYYTRFFMELLLGGVFAFFGVHTALWLPRSLRSRRQQGGPV